MWAAVRWLLLGRKQLIRAALLNNYPNGDTICRPCKVGKEEIVGMLAALERFLRMDHDAERKRIEDRLLLIASAVKHIPGIDTELFVYPIANHFPHLRVRWDQAAWKFTSDDCLQLLRDGDPRIEMTKDDDQNLVLTAFLLEEGEETIVARRLHEVMNGAQRLARTRS